MNKLLLAAILLCGLGIPVWSALPAASVTEAKAKAKETDADYVVLAYGKDWDKVGTRFKKTVWDKPGTFEKLESKTLVTGIEILENPTKEEEEKQKSEQKAFGQGVKSLPQIYLFDKTGFCYASFYGEELPRSMEKLSAKLQASQSLRKKRDALVARSEKASSGKEKARLLGQAGEIKGISRPKSLVDQIKKVDPKDESGYQKRFSFNIFDYHKYLKEPKEEALKAFTEVVNSPAYTPEQKQLVLGLQSTYLRKNKGTEKELQDTFRKMRSLDPNSLMGKAAVNAMKAYGKKEK